MAGTDSRMGLAAPTLGPPMDMMVPPKGYAWWYLDAVSDDGRHALTIIAFIGSVFSPYYAWSGRGDPLNHCSLNVALYGVSDRRWAMTERGRDAVARTPRRLAIGPSAIGWRDGALVVEIDERAAPLPRRVRGEIRLTPAVTPARSFYLDPAGRHVWQPVAPSARILVALEHPRLRWSGAAYHDANFGAEPLEAGFRDWTWGRAHLADRAVVFYDADRRDGGHTALALAIAPSGAITSLPAPPGAALPRGFWGLRRETRADVGATARIAMKMEDAPFYTRSLVETTLYGERVVAMHERLALDKFANRGIQALLPFRMPRAILRRRGLVLRAPDRP